MRFIEERVQNSGLDDWRWQGYLKGLFTDFTWGSAEPFLLLVVQFGPIHDTITSTVAASGIEKMKNILLHSSARDGSMDPQCKIGEQALEYDGF